MAIKSNNIEAVEILVNRINERVPVDLWKKPHFATLSKQVERLAQGIAAVETERTPAGVENLKYVTKEYRNTLQAEVLQAEANFQRAARKESEMLPDGFASEVRTKFASLDPGQKAQAIQKFIEGKNGPNMAAIMDAPSILTEITSEDVTKFSNQFFEATVPDMWQIRNQYTDLVEHVEGVLKIASTVAEGGDNE